VQGMYAFTWGMIQEGVARFGTPGSPVLVTVFGSDNAELCGVAGVPSELRTGRTANVSICLKNIGSNAWINGYCLRSAQGNLWGAATVCLAPGQQILSQQSHPFNFTITGPSQPGRWNFSYQLMNQDTDLFGATFATTIGVPLDFQGSADFSDTQGERGWFFRDLRSDGFWHKMTFQGDHWQGPGANQMIYPTWAHPGTNRVARFWKSGFTGTKIRVSGEVHDLDPGCGDGVVVKFRRKRNQMGSPILPDITITNGNVSPQQYGIELNDIAIDETIRFIIEARANTGCDTTFLDPLIQVLPPEHPNVGPIPNAQPIFNPEVESD